MSGNPCTFWSQRLLSSYSSAAPTSPICCLQELAAVRARWAVEGLLRIAPANLPRLSQVHLDQRVLWFTLGISMASGVIFGLVPAIAASRMDLAESLKESGRASSAGPARQRL